MHPPGVVDVVLSNAMSKHYIIVEIYFLSNQFKSMLYARLLRVESPDSDVFSRAKTADSCL